MALGNLRGQVSNVDATLICEAPRIGPHRAEMERNLAEALSAPVAVKATTNEGMGWIGAGEGIACFAVALAGGRLMCPATRRPAHGPLALGYEPDASLDGRQALPGRRHRPDELPRP